MRPQAARQIRWVRKLTMAPLQLPVQPRVSYGDLGEVLLHIICLHLSLGEEPTGLRPSDGSESQPLDIRAMGFAHGARLEQTFAYPAARVLPRIACGCARWTTPRFR